MTSVGGTAGAPAPRAGGPEADHGVPADDRVRAALPVLREAAEAAGAMLRRLGDAARAPGPEGGWTPTHVVVHLVAVDADVWLPRLRQLAAREHPVWTWTEPDIAVPDPAPEAAADAFCGGREVLLAVVRAMDGEALRSTGLHAAFGELDVAGLLGEVARHDAEHLASLADAVAAHAVEAPGGAGSPAASRG